MPAQQAFRLEPSDGTASALGLPGPTRLGLDLRNGMVSSLLLHTPTVDFVGLIRNPSDEAHNRQIDNDGSLGKKKGK